MQIPQEFQHFSKPTLIVIADHVHAQFWLAHELTAELLHEIDMPSELKSDNEGSFVNTDNGAVNGNEPNDDERIKQLTKEIAEAVATSVYEGEAETYHLVMIKELEEQVTSHLQDDVTEKASWPIDADLRQMPLVEVLERVVKKF